MLPHYNNKYGIIIRGITFIINPALFIAIINLIPNKKIVMVSNIGKTSLYIYALHRIPTLLLSYYLYPNKYYLLISIITSIILCCFITSVHKFLDILFKTKYLLLTSFLFIIILLIPLFDSHELNVNEYKELDNALTIGYVGDLILLEDQLKLSDNDFDYMFNNMKERFNNTDYVFGVLEGPVDDNSDYSYGNYSDNKELRLNYPTSFLKSIESAGIDFVTIANNHMLDRGTSAYNSTIANLNNSKLNYTGTKDNYKILSIKGVRIGVLAYTYGLNYLDSNNYEKYTNYLVDPYSKEFNKYKKQIHKDFVKLKKSNVDMIIVMPHYGTEFNYRIDIYQKRWNDFFVKEGANIILGDHSHVIEPIEYKNNSIIINSPGNYVNSYIGNDSDISMYVKLYINKNNHSIIAAEITPIIATKDSEGKYYPKLLKNTTSKNKDRVLEKISNVVLKNSVSKINNSYYYYPNKKYKYDNKYKLKLNNNDKKTLVYKKISENENICFIGDSITNGYKNGYKPWYLPLMSNFDKNIINISKESYTSYDIINKFSNKIEEAKCDLSIINVGTNDIRYNKENVNNYIDNIKRIVELTQGEDIVLSPWQTTENDYNISKKDKEKRKLYNTYNKELKKLDNAYCIDPNPYIKKVIQYNNENDYILDGVHPNNNEGIKLYSFAVLRGSDC
ncbi:MAG: CapA family protein [Bacilli bacterium]|nr:CapA family protein [Bacilli bacterium]